MAEEKKMDEVVEKKKEDVEKKTSQSKNVEKIMEAVKKMTVMELAELVKALEEEFGVTASAPVIAAVGAIPASQAAPVEEEKTDFNVILTSFGSNKIQVIKVVRAITGLGLKEAKDLVETAPKATIKEGVLKEEAGTIKKQLEEVGASVEYK